MPRPSILGGGGRYPSASIVLTIAIGLVLPTTALAQVKVIMSGGFATAYRKLLPAFEQATGIAVTTASGASQGKGPETIGAQLRRGVSADVVILVKVTARGSESAAMVAGGGADIAVQPVSELLHVAGIDFVGIIPAEVQYVSVFTAAVVAGSKQQEASQRLIAFLASTNGHAAIRDSGMEPPMKRHPD